MDEGSVGYSAMWYSMFFLRARLCMVRDIFHREWNDCKWAIAQAGLWHTVLLTSLVMNLCFGPWEGSGWFEKIKGSAADLLAKEGARGPLFSALYPSLCHDLGVEAEGTWAHKQTLLQQLPESGAFSLKGPRVALK
eukprot:2609131-Lingulodinium_polyedra.AAC.1